MFNAQTTIMKNLATYGYLAFLVVVGKPNELIEDQYQKELRRLNGTYIPVCLPPEFSLQT